MVGGGKGPNRAWEEYCLYYLNLWSHLSEEYSSQRVIHSPTSGDLGVIPIICTHVSGYEYPVGVQVMGWMVELYPLTFTLLVGAWVVLDNYRKRLDISIVRLVNGSCEP